MNYNPDHDGIDDYDYGAPARKRKRVFKTAHENPLVGERWTRTDDDLLTRAVQQEGSNWAGIEERFFSVSGRFIIYCCSAHVTSAGYGFGARLLQLCTVML